MSFSPGDQRGPNVIDALGAGHPSQVQSGSAGCPCFDPSVGEGTTCRSDLASPGDLNAEADVRRDSSRNVRPLVGDPYYIHHACGGRLTVTGECSVGYGVVNTLRCDKCAKEMDATCYDQFEGYQLQRSANNVMCVKE